MNEERYLATVHEQVQAYGYEPTDVPSELSAEALYKKQDRNRDLRYYVAVTELREEGVAPVRETSEKLREVVRERENPRPWSGVCCYPLLIPPSISEPMEIYIEEGYEIFGGDGMIATDTTVFPVLVDMENERLVYRQSTGIKKWFYENGMGKEIKNMFQV